jgi:hypothetical protein
VGLEDDIDALLRGLETPVSGGEKLFTKVRSAHSGGSGDCDAAIGTDFRWNPA